ncbi:MAG: hypothetical protein TREMPRED_002515 [Tremellales sp. Tagirdzhanova-0007]|nr:MAG: hypothetical protein TREMPRED_002515 [Tremellales sp. Tagirdzhanova-0007]
MSSSSPRSSTRANGKSPVEKDPTRVWRDGSLELSDDNEGNSARRSTRPVKSTAYDRLPTLPTIPDPDTTEMGASTSKPPPPAPSTALAKTGSERIERPGTRKRRSSSIKRKLSPGVTPTTVVDWEIPRKALHSSIGVITLILNHLDPPTIRPLLTLLITILAIVVSADVLRLNVPSFAEFWESYLGFLMRESERNKVNGVIWYLVGVITVLGLYPRDVAVVSILTLSWSDTTASTLGRLWGKYTPPLPSHLPGVKGLPFAARKSLAGFLAATVTGILICSGFWWKGSLGRWTVLDDQAWWGLWVTAAVVGFGGAVVEALDLGLDDNLTLPILSGAIIWLWLAAGRVLPSATRYLKTMGDLTSSKPSGLIASLGRHNETFTTLLALIPARYYLAPTPEEADNKWMKNKKRKTGEEIKEHKRRVKHEKLDPSNNLTLAPKIEAAVIESTPQTSTKTSSSVNPILPLPPTASVSELRAKLQSKLDTFRRDRGVDEDAEPQSRDALEAARRVKRGEMRDRRRKERKEERRKEIAKPAKTQLLVPEIVRDQDTLSFPAVSLPSSSSTSKPKAPLKTLSNPSQALAHLTKHNAQLASLPEERRREAEERERWAKAEERAGGGKIADQEGVLKKAVKRAEKGKAKSGQEWAERKKTVEKGHAAAAKKRNDNIASRAEARRNKRMGIKDKGKGKEKEKRMGKAKGKSKKGRPGFEGGRKEKPQKT